MLHASLSSPPQLCTSPRTLPRARTEQHSNAPETLMVPFRDLLLLWGQIKHPIDPCSATALPTPLLLGTSQKFEV